MVQADPGGAAGGVKQGVQQRPIAHRICAVFHGFGLAVRAGHAAGVQVVAADDDGRFQLSGAHHFVERQPRLVPFTQPQPADARGQALKGDALARHVEPAVRVRVVGEQFLDLGVGLVDVLRVATQRHPAERPFALAEQRADVGGHEAGEVKRVLHALVQRHLSDVVAVIDHRDAHALEVEHGLHVLRAALRGGGGQRGVLRGVGGGGFPLRDAPARGQVAVDEVVRAGLVGHQVGAQSAALRALDQFGQHLGRVAEQSDRYRFTRLRVLLQ